MNILLLPASLRKDSLNSKLCRIVGRRLQENHGSQVNLADLKCLALPPYDGDIESAEGIPDGVNTLVAQIREAQAIVVGSPEYNGSISGILKNTIDWVSRVKPNPLKGKYVLLLSASPGALGGIRGLWHSRVPFEALGCHVYPEMLALGKASEVISPDLQILDEKVRANLERLADEFVSHIAR
jgi:NAD(P)H-dependent FMN reductase